MNRDEDPQLWDLLGQCKRPAASPFFSRDVLRAVRNESQNRSGFAGWFSVRRLVPALSAAAAVVIAAFTFQALHHHRHRASQQGLASAEVQEAELVADLDVLVSDDDSDDTLLL